LFRTSPFLRWEKLRCTQQAKAHKKKPHKWLIYAIYEALFYIQATLFILKRQNPLSSPIFSFKAS